VNLHINHLNKSGLNKLIIVVSGELNVNEFNLAVKKRFKVPEEMHVDLCVVEI